ncbi:hypothetical protein GW915_12700 [bacterium]|nr:hypothetical protein [bacterium]
MRTLFLSLAFAFSLASQAQKKPAPFSDLMASQSWKTFVSSLSYFHKFQPGLYQPPELIRFDRLPLLELTQLSDEYAQKWKKVFDIDRIEARRHSQLEVSKKANQAVDDLLRRHSKLVDTKGSKSEIIKTIAEDQRVALTPLDPSFKLSELGQKIQSQSQLKKGANWDSFTISDTKKLLKLEDSQTGSSFVVGPKPTAGNRLTLRSIFLPDRSPATTDISFSNSYLSGELFGRPNSSPYPFGNYIGSEDLFTDEQGVQHFGGDGHNHNHPH